MKSLLTSVLFLLSASTFATVTLHSESMTCSELRDAIADNREVIVIQKGIFGNFWTRAYSERWNCGVLTMPTDGHFKTSDKRYCKAGYICDRIHENN